MSRTVVAIGGNALSANASEQEEQLRKAAKALRPILLSGNEIVLVHGNGPQVGIIHGAFDYARQQNNGADMPFYDCTAMNEGAIGYHLEQAILSELRNEGGEAGARTATVLTRVVVDPNDPAFSDPVKPVGSFYTEEQARKLMKETGKKYGPDSGRGWRLMVPSPEPKHIVEADFIRLLAEQGVIVLGGGGAGIPVVGNEETGYTPIEAVCDKDLTSAMLAQLIDADLLLILTAVDQVCLNYGTPEQQNLSELSPEQAEEYIAQGQFAPGSMLPKVEGCVRFVRGAPGRRAVIGNLAQAGEVLMGHAGTVFEDRTNGESAPRTGAGKGADDQATH